MGGLDPPIQGNNHRLLFLDGRLEAGHGGE
jgi:hypothetical protein